MKAFIIKHPIKYSYFLGKFKASCDGFCGEGDTIKEANDNLIRELIQCLNILIKLKNTELHPVKL